LHKDEIDSKETPKTKSIEINSIVVNSTPINPMIRMNIGGPLKIKFGIVTRTDIIENDARKINHT
jgi:hypothetical protein